MAIESLCAFDSKGRTYLLKGNNLVSRVIKPQYVYKHDPDEDWGWRGRSELGYLVELENLKTIKYQ
jgi:hypothetical protein